MSILDGANNVLITGGTQIAAGGSVNIYQDGQTNARNSLKELSAHIAHAALYNSAARFDAPRCHRNTRMSYLDGFERWMLGQGSDYDHAGMIWLTGGAGVGKSAIMQSIVERTAQFSVILGTFFFSRADASRNYAEVLIPTLAYQLARAFPAAMTVLSPVIENDPLIFSASLQTQANDLLVRPLRHLIDAGIIEPAGASRLVFVVDGLDECEDPKKQALVIQVISNILSNHDLHVSFLVASRPEVAISQAILSEKSLHFVLATITLGEDMEARSDIRKFIVDSFLDIRDSHPQREYIPENWPHPDSVDRLVRKSSGHFIYAATAMKFILCRDEHPERALRVIEGLEASRTGSPFAELDALYRHIIISARYSSQVMRILAHCIHPNLNDTVTSICFMNPEWTQKDVALYLSDVSALVSLSLHTEVGLYLFIKHASLHDFLNDAKRSEPLDVNSNRYLASCLPRYFDMLDVDPKVAAFQLRQAHGKSFYDLSSAWYIAMCLFSDGDLLYRLVTRHSPREVWNLASHCKAASLFRDSHVTGATLDFLTRYLFAIHCSAANKQDNALYNQQFGQFITLLVEEIRFTHREHELIPALLFSSTPASLEANFPHHLTVEFAKLGFYVSSGHFFIGHSDSVRPGKMPFLSRLPESQLSWGSNLAYMMGPVIDHLVSFAFTPEHLNMDQCERCLQRMRPKRSPSKFRCAFCTRLFAMLPHPGSKNYSHALAVSGLQRAGYGYQASAQITQTRYQCYIFLKAIVSYLPKCGYPQEIVPSARKSLPTEGELWFPRLTKGARTVMDAYILRWEASYEGVIEKTKSMTLNKLD